MRNQAGRTAEEGRKENGIKGSSLRKEHTEGKRIAESYCTAWQDIRRVYGISERKTAAVGRKKAGGTQWQSMKLNTHYLESVS